MNVSTVVYSVLWILVILHNFRGTEGPILTGLGLLIGTDLPPIVSGM